MRQPVSHGRARRSQTASLLRSAAGSALRSRHDATSAAAVQDPSRPVSLLSLGALGLVEIGTPPQRRSPWFPSLSRRRTVSSSAFPLTTRCAAFYWHERAHPEPISRRLQFARSEVSGGL